MKKSLIRIALFTLLLGILIIPGEKASAYEFEVCYHCNGTGKFHCASCNDRGEVYCGMCAGKGGWACVFCDGVGYEICPSCYGYGEMGYGPEDGPDAEHYTCGNCDGSGKLECIKCHGEGREICQACGGKGYAECQSHECKSHKENNWVCTYCNGTGFMGVGFDFKPEWNDGVKNVPKEGNLIWYNGNKNTYRYHKTLTDSEKKKKAEELDAYKKKALENLEKVRNLYSDGLYSTKQLKKLNSTYEKAVKQVNKAEIYDEVSTAYYKYKGLLLDIRPAVLEKYKEKCKKKIRKTYADLEKAYCVEDGFWDRKLEQVMGDGIEELIKAKTKLKVKKIMNKTLAKLVW